ncbi:MAG: hypothetical protein FK732_06015 [Asgard group archaeon]|nr:hypothetical protein [Asgard group archaeon]
MTKEESYTKLEWEILERIVGKNFRYFVRRAPVPGGWLIETSKYTLERKVEFLHGSVSGAGYGVGITFVPDPEHKWQGLEIVKYIEVNE